MKIEHSGNFEDNMIIFMIGKKLDRKMFKNASRWEEIAIIFVIKSTRRN